MKVLFALLGAAATIGFAAPANADPFPASVGSNPGFLASLQHAGIRYVDPNAAIRSAQAVCTLLSDGEPGLTLLADLETDNPGLDLDRASDFAVIAAQSFCPQQLSK